MTRMHGVSAPAVWGLVCTALLPASMGEAAARAGAGAGAGGGAGLGTAPARPCALVAWGVNGAALLDGPVPPAGSGSRLWGAQPGAPAALLLAAAVAAVRAAALPPPPPPPPPPPWLSRVALPAALGLSLPARCAAALGVLTGDERGSTPAGAGGRLAAAGSGRLGTPLGAGEGAPAAAAAARLAKEAAYFRSHLLPAPGAFCRAGGAAVGVAAGARGSPPAAVLLLLLLLLIMLLLGNMLLLLAAALCALMVCPLEEGEEEQEEEGAVPTLPAAHAGAEVAVGAAALVAMGWARLGLMPVAALPLPFSALLTAAASEGPAVALWEVVAEGWGGAGAPSPLTPAAAALLSLLPSEPAPAAWLCPAVGVGCERRCRQPPHSPGPRCRQPRGLLTYLHGRKKDGGWAVRHSVCCAPHAASTEQQVRPASGDGCQALSAPACPHLFRCSSLREVVRLCQTHASALCPFAH